MLKTVDEKIDDAVYAAMEALGLSVVYNQDTADLLNDYLHELVENLVTDDDDED